MHMELTLNRGGGHKLLVDGHDISLAVLAKGVVIDLSEPDFPRVTLTLAPKSLDIDGVVLMELRDQAAAEINSGTGV